MTGNRTHDSASSHRDRRVGLAFFGAIEILIGLACAAFIPLTLMMVAFSPVMDARVVVPSLVLYGVMAALFIALGVGSMKARCWAQALSLSLSWVWLITGICTMVFGWWFLPAVSDFLGASSGLDPATGQMVILGLGLFLGAIYILLPGAFILFYRSPHVIATCRIRDPNPGWAGRCPQQLLALTMAYGLGGLSITAVPSYGYVFPFFGVLLSGASGAACWVVSAVLSWALAWGTCRREPWAWWTAMAAGAGAGVSSAITFAVIDADQLFQVGGLLADQRELFEAVWPASPWVHIVIQVVIWGSFLGYLIVVKPLFNPPLGRGKLEG